MDIFLVIMIIVVNRYVHVRKIRVDAELHLEHVRPLLLEFVTVMMGLVIIVVLADTVIVIQRVVLQFIVHILVACGFVDLAANLDFLMVH